MKKEFIILFLLIIVSGSFYLLPNKENFDKKNYKGVICLIIDDFGYSNNELSKEFLSMHPDFTVAIIPGLKYSNYISILSDSLEFENIVHMPMEANSQGSYSNNAYLINSKLNEVEVESMINRAFLEIPTAIGMNNHQGSKATEDLQLMKYVARSLKKRDKFFLDSFTNPESRGFITMRRYGVKTELRQVFLDHIDSKEHIQAQLDSLVSLSHVMDVAIGIGHVKQVTLDLLKKEIPKLKALGYKFVPLSIVVR